MYLCENTGYGPRPRCERLATWPVQAQAGVLPSSMMFSSSRTLPGQSYASSPARAPRERPGTSFLYSRAYLRMKPDDLKTRDNLP